MPETNLPDSVAADLCKKHERKVATWQQAREMLGLALAG